MAQMQEIYRICVDPFFGPFSIITNGTNSMASVGPELGNLYLVSEYKYNTTTLTKCTR